jgi:hypothetical protein
MGTPEEDDTERFLSSSSPLLVIVVVNNNMLLGVGEVVLLRRPSRSCESQAHKLQRAGADAAKSHMTLRRLVPSFYVGPVNESLPTLPFRIFLPKTRWQTREETMENDIQSQFSLVLRLG